MARRGAPAQLVEGRPVTRPEVSIERRPGLVLRRWSWSLWWRGASGAGPVLTATAWSHRRAIAMTAKLERLGRVAAFRARS